MISPEESSQINCPQCGAPLEAGLPACPVCGAALAGGASARLPGPAAGPAATPAAPAYPTYVYPPPAPAQQAPPMVAPSPAPQVAATPPRRTGLWVGLGLGLVLGLCLVMFIGGAALFVVSRSQLFVAPTPTPPDPTALIDQATEAQGQAKTLHYLMTGEISGASSQASGQVELEGDVVPPDRYTMHSNQYGDRIVIGPDVYTRPTGSTTWQQSQADPDQQADPTANPTALLNFLKYYDPGSVALQDDVISGTQRLHFIRFEIDVERMAAAEGAGSPGAALLGASVQGTVRIDSATNLIERMTLLISAPGSGNATFTINLSRYNIPVTITPPAAQDQ